ncbi:FxSxx-COOH system tetratricopeptide repeat protein [Jidongwangia harbinensis]|uniref:FxSxx-COOH system tetratricopeptide repeat protein n=1 Tax=Jidongwangia harbinensis TaxID=2878561 RepID=UPI001CD9EBF8|nr:FxSxx-COOH system tetratricopeptide repeat protein [Jidongwangia harbinensis]MCA2215727.1 tetratricopeptide repeat protein [Jidongwangia harbinensis]
MTRGRDGQVVTFYSYKGGTGRTMALANVAWILAANGYRVLAVDWDLESPGLHRFFQPFMDPGFLASTRGVVDMINLYEWDSSKPEWDPAQAGGYASVQQYSFSLDWDHFPEGGTLDFLSAGQQNPVYEGVLSNINWDDFYQNGDGSGGRFFDAMRADMKDRYDFTLIDSRTGHSDIAGICTSHLPDVLVDCFTFSGQGIEGAARMARQLHSPRDIRVLPVPMRVDPAEKRKAETGRTVAMREFADLPSGLDEDGRRAYWHGVEVPYQAYYAYEEVLATFGDAPGASGTLLRAYESLATQITGGRVTALPPMSPNLRAQFIARFERKPFSETDVVLLSAAGIDQVWLEWVEHVLSNGGFRVVRALAESGDGTDVPSADAQHLKIISRAEGVSAFSGAPGTPTGEPELRAIYTADITPWRRIPTANSAFIAGLGAATAAARILELVGRPAGDLDVLLAGAPRYPGDEPDLVVNLPARNARFTGRETGLRAVRDQLRSGTAVVLFGTQAVALQGMGGVGKTQMALEYAYRYRAAYDVVAWLNADTEESLQGSLRDLGARLNLQSEQSGPDYARAVVQELSRDKRRWLLILDNADEPEAVRTYLPHGPGHVLITSRNKAWGEQTQPLEVDVFTRDESIEHLVQRVGTIDRKDAGLVAEQLADLPIAVAAAAAWLHETHTSVTEYLQLIQEEGPSAVLTAMTDRPIARTWDLSLTRLRERDHAAYRLFQLCSVLAPEIPLDLIFSDQMAEYLKPYNPALSERLLRGSLVQQINRLALLRLDQRPASSGDGDRSGRILIHRVVQNVVRDRMTEEELAQARLQVHQVLARARPEGDVDDPQHWARFRLLWPHLDASDAVHSTEEPVRQLLIDRVRYYYVQADPVTGRDRAERVARIWERQLADTTDPVAAAVLLRQLLQLRFNLANLLRDLGEFELSRQLDEQVLAEQVRLLGPDHPHTLMTRGSYAADLRGLGRYPEALQLDIETYSAWQDLYGEDNTRTLAARNNLAVSYRLMGLFREAGEHDREAWERRQEVNGETNLWTLGTAACLARDWRDAGDFDRSAALLKQTLDHLVHTRGPDSRSTLTTKSNYAVSLRSLGRIDEALQLHQEAYARLLELFGSDNPETVSCRFSLALTLLSAGEGDQAIAELLAIQAFWKRRLGDRHPYTLVCMNDLAIADRRLGRFSDARDWIRPTVESLSDVLGPEHPYTLSAQMNLAICEADPSEGGTGPATAREALLGIADGVRRVFGPEHPNTFRFEANLALVEDALGADAVDDRLAALRERVILRLGETHPIVNGLDRRRYLYRIIDPHQF